MHAIKESFDSLPIAICFFTERGLLRLTNHRMLAVASILSSKGIQTFPELQNALQNPPARVQCLNKALWIYHFPDGTDLRFTSERVQTKAGLFYTQVTAADVTDLIRRQNQLQQENERLTEANQRARRLLEQMPEIVREEETLAIKQRIHDDLGHSILSARRALTGNKSLEEIRAGAAAWRQAVAVLNRVNRLNASTGTLAYAELRAEELGVRVVWEGMQPGSASVRTLLCTAICECAANCVRHAGGTELTVQVRRKLGSCAVSIINNGSAPKGKITEGGGLSMLRRRVEATGGKMEVRSNPRFQLVLDLPEKEETRNASDDC